jgi:phosphate transport system protein
MPFKFLLGSGGERLDRVEAMVREMFGYDRREFDLAMAALMGDVAAADVNAELRGLDQRVNALERTMRRELVVHATVQAGIDTPAVMVYMSTVKDVERLGDYAKNLLDLARDGASFAALEDAEEWRQLATDVSSRIAQVGDAFLARDERRAHELLTRTSQLLYLFDRRVSALVRGDDTRPQAVARALAYRYLKRIVAHLMNVLSAVVMPVDKIDYFDEDPEDR